VTRARRARWRGTVAGVLLGVALPMTAGASPVEVVRAMADAWQRLDLEAVIELFAADGVFHSVMLEPIRGHQALRAHFAPVFADLTRAELRTVNLAAQGYLVFFERVDDFVYRGNHAQVPVMGVIEVVDGRIREWRDYYDRATMVAAMSGSAAPQPGP
jgi:limonene-1,2-epoxide hydrolase